MLGNAPSAAGVETCSPRGLFISFLASARFQIPAIAGIAVLLFFFRLGVGALLDWDEATYAEVSREMAASGNWLLPTWAHQPFFEKPPLLFWLQAGLFHCFGVTEFWARFPSAIAAVGVVVLIYFIARRLASPAAGIFAAFALMTMNHFDRAAREGMTDALLCFCIFLAIYAWLRLTREYPAWLYLLSAAIGVGALIKGPAILVAPLAIAADWLITRNPEKLLPRRHYLFGTLLVFAIVAPWHIWMVAHYGHAFLHQYVGIQLGQRVTTVFQGSAGGPAYYLHIILLGAFPWSVVALIALGRSIWTRDSSNFLIWILAGIVLAGYSVLPTGHQWYILPVYPAIGIEVGILLADAARWRVTRYAAFAVLAAGMLVAFVKLVRRQGDSFTNQDAYLATMARSSSGAGPLLIIPAPGTGSQLDVPTAVFYSNRPAIYISLPDDDAELARLLRTHGTMDAIIQNGAVTDLSGACSIRVKAVNSTADYAIISGRDLAKL